MNLSEQDISRRVMRLLNLELVRDQEQVARVVNLNGQQADSGGASLLACSQLPRAASVHGEVAAARSLSSAPVAEHHASALPPADLHTSVPAAGVSFFPAVVSNHPLSERVHCPAACAVGPAGDPLP